MEILPARGRRRRDGRSAASASAFPWEQAPVDPHLPAEGDASSGAEDAPAPDDGYGHAYDPVHGSDRAADDDSSYQPLDDDAYSGYDPGAGYDSEAGYDPGAGYDSGADDAAEQEASAGSYLYQPEGHQPDSHGAGAASGLDAADPGYVEDQRGGGVADEGAYWEDQGYAEEDWSVQGPDDTWAGDSWQPDTHGGGGYPPSPDDDEHDNASHHGPWSDEDAASGGAATEDAPAAGHGAALEDGAAPEDGAGPERDAAAVTGRRSRRSEPGPGRRRPSAGRNLPAAIAVGAGLGGLIAASLFIRKEAFVAVVAVAVGLAVWELAQAFTARRITVPLVPVLVGSLGMVVSGFASGEEAMLVAFALTSLAVLLWRVIDGFDGAVRDVAAGIFSAAYVPFLAGFAMLMLAADDGPARIVVFVLVTVASDVGGYAVGVVAGRHPMAPSVSPKKSWEGLGGSVAFCLVTGMVSVPLLLGGPWWAGALLGLATVVTATVGDLSESLLKRDLGIKDMGSLLPGHGGMMDRLDSLLPTAPAAYLLLSVLVPVAS